MYKGKDSQLVMLEHSKAKVELFGRYLSIYLNVISRVPFISKIYLFDLFAGEGKYLNNERGSALVAMEAIKNHYESNNHSCPNIEIWYNDDGKSKIEPNLYKIERVKKFVDEIFKPSSVKTKFTREEYSKVIKEVITQLDAMKSSERALLFIDPWGYKEIRPREIRDIIINGKSELLLFLPISFMYRFADKARTDEDFLGGQALEIFLSELFGKKIPDTDNQIKFIDEVKQEFKKYLNINYVDTFTIERGKNNFFCLFFFTSNKTGYYKMLSSKWDLDEESGRGFRIVNPSQSVMFDAVAALDYSAMVFDFLKMNQSATNQDLFDFGLENGFLPRHTKKVLDEMQRQNKIELISLDNEPVNGYYIEDNHKRRINIKLKQWRSQA